MQLYNRSLQNGNCSPDRQKRYNDEEINGDVDSDEEQNNVEKQSDDNRRMIPIIRIIKKRYNKKNNRASENRSPIRTKRKQVPHNQRQDAFGETTFLRSSSKHQIVDQNYNR